MPKRIRPLGACLSAFYWVSILPVAISAAEQVLPRIGARVDLAAFSRPLPEDEGPGVEWDMWHDIEEVHVTGLEASLAPSLRVEWWGSVWPANGSGGWKKLDDPWNGRWVRFHAPPQIKDGRFVFSFTPLDKKEWEKAIPPEPYEDKKNPSWRRTLKVRLVATDGTRPTAGVKIEAYGASEWNRGAFQVELRHPTAQLLGAQIQLVNGRLVTMTSLPAPRDAAIRGASWSATKPAGMSSGVILDLFYVDNQDFDSNDLTRVAVRLGNEPSASGFSFVPQDVLRDSAMRLPSLGVLVSEVSKRITLANDAGPDKVNWDRPVRLRLTEKPEMTRAAAMQGIPRLAPPPWIPLGVPSARQEFFIGPGGDWSIWGESLRTKDARDFPRLVFRRRTKDAGPDRLSGLFDTRKQPRFDGGGRDGCLRRLEDGYLPLIHAEWNTGPIHYHHRLGVSSLQGRYGDDVGRRGDETNVLLTKMEIANTSDSAAPAFLNLRYSHPAPIALRDDGIIAITDNDPKRIPAGRTALRGQISVDKSVDGGATGWRIVPGEDPECSSVLQYTVTLQPNETKVVYFKTPFVDFLEADELARLKEIDYEIEIPMTLDYWRSRLSKGMIIETPDPAVNDFYRANLWHVIITTDRDPKTGLYNQGVGTVRYGVFANETVMIARMMDMRGEPVEAERFLEPMLRYQGERPLKGRFSTKENVFHSAGEYTHGEYAMNHGFVLWGVADHYLMTRDRTYLERTAPQIVKGCDFLIAERKRTMGKPGAPRPPMQGLAPASSLEDVVEYEYWFAVNGYFYLGMKRVAQALAEIDHPDAGRIAAEAEKYRRDIEISLREAITQAAAVKLRDGNYVPYAPSRIWQWRHLTEGWIREALYPSLHVATSEVVSPDDPLIGWLLDDLEDNIFFSRQSGINLVDFEKTWFEKGALTLQPCLLDLPTIYMARNEIQAALRSFWNTYAFSIFPDVRCFTEWARDFGQPAGPLYKTSDESRWVMWLRQLLVWEDAERLWFGRGVPGDWLGNGKTIQVAKASTIFGTAGLRVHSEIDVGRIEASVSIPNRNPPAEVWLRLRHPGGSKPVRVFVNNQAWPVDQVVGQDIRLLPSADLDITKPILVVAEYRLSK
jgi:hypothetical protein